MCHGGSVKETTIAADVEINHVADSDIDDSKKSLILLLELLLIENLYGKYTIFGCSPRWCQTLSCYALASQRNVHVKDFVPIRIQCLLDDRGRSCLFAADCRNCEGIRES
jgi:hypothetical protein